MYTAPCVCITSLIYQAAKVVTIANSMVYNSQQVSWETAVCIRACDYGSYFGFWWLVDMECNKYCVVFPA